MSIATEHIFPQVYKNFILLNPAGAGGMGQVYRAITLDEINRVVIIKKTFEHLRTDSSYIKMFFDEVKVLSFLNHPNIVNLYGYGEQAEYMEMEYVRGQSLAQLLVAIEAKGERIPIEVAVYVVHEVAKALSYAHELRDDAKSLPLGIVHRDISPQNIMVTYKGSVKILDFGISKFREKLNVTETGVFVGKRNYIAPEQNRAEKVGPAADIFSLGAVLWRLLTGRVPFEMSSLAEYSRIAANGDMPAPSHYNSQASKKLDQICAKALQQKPENRFSSMAEFQQELREVSKEIHQENSVVRKTAEWMQAHFKDQMNSDEHSLREGLQKAAEMAKSLRQIHDKTQVLGSAEPQRIATRDSKFKFEKWSAKQKLIAMTLAILTAFLLGFFIKSMGERSGERKISLFHLFESQAERLQTELEMLAEQRQFEEVVPRLKEVAATERNEAWKKLALHSITEVLKQNQARDINKAFEYLETFDTQFPFLLSTEAYLKLHSEIGLAWFEVCATGSGNCIERFLPFVKMDSKNAELAFLAGRRVTYHYFHYLALPFFQLALERAKEKRYCEDERTKSAIEIGSSFGESEVTGILARQLDGLCKEIK